MPSVHTSLAALVLLFTSVTLAQNAAPASAPAPGPLAITATPDPATVHPGDSLKFDVTIKNTSANDQVIQVPNIIWAAVTDVPQITIPGWPARGGIGPAVTFQKVTIKPSDTYKHTWSATVARDAAEGDVTLRVGVPLDGPGSGKTWSDPVKVTIAAKDATTQAAKQANPLYAPWKGQVGKSVTFTRQETISGGAPVPAGQARAPSTTSMVYSLSSLDDEKAVVWVHDLTPNNAIGESFDVMARSLPDDPAFPKEAGKEDLKIGTKTYACTKYTYTSDSRAEIGRDPQGLHARVTVWVADGIPGGIVQRHITLTIRASYDILDTLVDK